MNANDYEFKVVEIPDDTSMLFIGHTPVGMVKNFPAGDHKIYQVMVDIPFTSREDAEEALKMAICAILDYKSPKK